jgi:hypothetical protein
MHAATDESTHRSPVNPRLPASAPATSKCPRSLSCDRVLAAFSETTQDSSQVLAQQCISSLAGSEPQCEKVLLPSCNYSPVIGMDVILDFR